VSHTGRSKTKTQHEALTQSRLTLFHNGYHPIPTKGKMALVKGWPSQDFLDREMDEKRIESWPRRYPELQSTGVRVDQGLVVIDGDVDDAELAALAWQAIATVVYDIAATAPARFGKSEHKFALFAHFTGETTFRYEASHGYVRPLELALWQSALAGAAKGERVPEPTTHRLEIFGSYAGGPCPQHFGVVGPHSYHDDGSVAAEYRWGEGPTLETTPLSGLPVISHEQVVEILVLFERMATEAGWVPLSEPIGANSTVAYDITEASRFDTNKGGEQIDYAELCADFAVHGSSLRCSASFIPGRGDAGDRSHCSVGDQNRHGCVAVYVFGDAVTHFPAELKPGREQSILDEAMPLPIAELLPDEPPEPDGSADLHAKAAWLVETRAYHEGGDAVVRTYATSLDCESTPSAFSRRYRHMHMPNPDKRFKRPVFATDLWEMTPHRRNIDGVRMAPDRPFPLFEEGGRLWKNTYRRPRHATNGTVNVATLNVPFVAFMERFVPDPGERSWLLDWMAHKWLHPEIPGTAVIFVADTDDDIREGTFGTGRGLLFRIAHKLYGEQYVRSQAFSMLEGSSGQSTFNDWMHGSVLVTIDEAKTSPTAYRRGERSATYEVLKDVVDPAPKRFRFNGKYKQAFDGMSYCSFWVASNHADALAIPENDRRFTVLRNGRPIEAGEATAIASWMEDPANIAALSMQLAGRNLTNFNMMVPLMTSGKAEMAELARSDVEEILRDLMEDKARGKAFVKAHIEAVIEHNFNGQGVYWRGEFKEAWSRFCVGLKTPAGGPRRVALYGTQRKLFCFRAKRREVDHMPEAAIRREAAKWGVLDPVKGLEETTGLGNKNE
jgi:hypothetical protein